MRGFLKVFGYPDPKLSTGYNIRTDFQQLITSLQQLGVILGNLALGQIGTRVGRRFSFLVPITAALLGITILIASTNKGSVVFGRMVLGISNGIFTSMSVIYVSEAAPAHMRGGLVAIQQLAANVGSIVGAVVNNRTKSIESRLSYQIPLIILYLVPIYFLVLIWFIPESPRWLVTRGRNEEAKKALYKMRGSGWDSRLVDAELLSIKDAVAAEQELSISTKSAFREMFSSRERKRSLITIAALTFHAASGFTFMAGYSTYFFVIAGSTDAFKDSLLVTGISLIGAVSGLFLNRYVGRRPMLLSACAIQAVIMFTIAGTWSALAGTQTAAKVVVAMAIIFQTVLSASCGPTSLIVGGEIASARLRAASYGVGTCVGFLAGFVAQLTGPYFINPSDLNIGPQVGYIWGSSNVIILIFVFFCLPETHRRSLENVDEMFYAKVPLRKFQKYQCSGIIHVNELETMEKNETQLTEVEVVDRLQD